MSAPVPTRRRSFLIGSSAALVALGTSRLVRAAVAGTDTSWHRQLAALEQASKVRCGVVAIDGATGRQLAYRGQERFAFCSTFKVMLVSAILARSVAQPGLMAQIIVYNASDLVPYSPITSKHTGRGLAVADLCAAALQYSDNTAANLLIARLGGVSAVNAFARSVGDTVFRLDRTETELNTAIPGDLRDTSTPVAMAQSLLKLTTGFAQAQASYVLPPLQREQLCRWLAGNTTGDQRIRASMPHGWQVGDKTGTGDYGTANDLALITPQDKAPWALAIYTAQPDKKAAAREDVIRQAAQIALGWYQAENPSSD